MYDFVGKIHQLAISKLEADLPIWIESCLSDYRQPLFIRVDGAMDSTLFLHPHEQILNLVFLQPRSVAGLPIILVIAIPHIVLFTRTSDSPNLMSVVGSAVPTDQLAREWMPGIYCRSSLSMAFQHFLYTVKSVCGVLPF